MDTHMGKGADIAGPVDEKLRRELEEPLPNGPAFAAFIAAGIGSFFLGLFTTLAEASESFKDRLVLNEGVGPLSGKTIYAVVIWVVAWAVLGGAWRKRDVNPRVATIVSLALIGLGVLLTYPTFFEQFAPE